MSSSRLDAVYRSILITKFFSKGWGNPENLRRLFEFRKVVSNREKCFGLIERDYPVTITKEENLSDCRLLEGYFTSPLEKYLPGIVPEIAQKAHFQVVLPVHWREQNCKPVCLHLAGTGDHFFWRRRNLMVKPLLKEAGIGGIILENPFYGLRKPVDQVRSCLHNVSDIFVMGGCLILEALVLFHWCERNGLGPLGVTGLSMGGHVRHIRRQSLRQLNELTKQTNVGFQMASLAATNWPKPLVLVPCLSWSTASAVFLQGVMSHSINWDLLEDQYLSDGIYRDKLKKMVTIVDEAFLAGKKFARKYADQIGSNPLENITVGETKLTDDLKSHTSLKKHIPFDITYDESPAIIETPFQNEIEKTVLKEHTASDTTPEKLSLENLNKELKRLRDEGKMNRHLYNKLTSNDKFELDSREIDQINQLTENKINEVILSCKVAEMKTLIKENEQMFHLEAKEAKRRSWHVSDLTADLWTNLPFIKRARNQRKIDIGKIHWRDREALQFMRGIMDECTHLSNFSVPYDTSLIIAVYANHDAYVPRDDVGTLEEIWPGADVRYVDAGHVSAYILHQSLFRSCIKEAFERSKKKWKDGKHVD